MKHSWKKQAWKYATAFIVALIVFNPEMVGLALFIDAIGLEIFFMLIEVQIFVVLGILVTKLKPIFGYLKKDTSVFMEHFHGKMFHKYHYFVYLAKLQ